MSSQEEYCVETSFNKICPQCEVGNPDDAEYCIICDKNLTETVLFLADEFYDLEFTSDTMIEYRKNFYRTRRTGKVQHFMIDKMEQITFGSPVTRFKFKYNDEDVVYALKKENYDRLMDLMIKMGKFDVI